MQAGAGDFIHVSRGNPSEKEEGSEFIGKHTLRHKVEEPLEVIRSNEHCITVIHSDATIERIARGSRRKHPHQNRSARMIQTISQFGSRVGSTRL